MDYTQAAQLLNFFAPGEPAFVQHSRVVAGVATKIAHALAESKSDIDTDRIRVRALLHDLGRSKTHGNYHGWVGYAMLRHRGLAEYGRGCVTHWLRGLSMEEVLNMSGARPKFISRVFEELELPRLLVDDIIVSVADFSVAHTTIVSLEARESDLTARYGDSRWLRRNGELAREHRLQIERWTGRKFTEIIPEAGRGAEHISAPDFIKSKNP